MTTPHKSALFALRLPCEIRDRAVYVLDQIAAAWAPFLANQARALGDGLVMGLDAVDAVPVKQRIALGAVFKAAERAQLDALIAKAASNPHHPLLMDERAAFSAFHVNRTKKEVEQQPKSGSYNDGWTTGAHEAWFTRADLARAAARPVQGGCGACGQPLEPAAATVSPV